MSVSVVTPVATPLTEGTVVNYQGSQTDMHGPMVIMAVYSNGTLGLASAAGVLYGVRPGSVIA